MKNMLILFSAFLLLSGCKQQQSEPPVVDEQEEVSESAENGNSKLEDDSVKDQIEEAPEDSQENEKLILESEFFNDIQMINDVPTITNADNQLVLVNKDFSLPEDYSPNDLVRPEVAFSFGNQDIDKSYLRKEAATALEHMFSQANTEGIELLAASGFRSYDTQKFLFDQEVATVGEEQALHAVAYPGKSEHQTGLTMDITAKSVDSLLTEAFEETVEGKWLADHAHEYGFILRYPKGKEEVTGYQYEPWHFRYVGTDVATIIYERKWTLEEYFQNVEKM